MAAAVLTGALVGVFQVAVVWGTGIATAIYLTGSLSGAHMNPAVTVSLATVGRFPWRRVPGHILIQVTREHLSQVRFSTASIPCH